MTEKDIATAFATVLSGLLLALAKQGVINGEVALIDATNAIDDVRRGANDDGPAGRILRELTARLLSTEDGGAG